MFVNPDKYLCYLNAVVQLITRTRVLRIMLLNQVRCELSECVSCILREIVNLTTPESHEPIDLRQLFSEALRKRILGDDHDLEGQHCVIEFLEELLVQWRADMLAGHSGIGEDSSLGRFEELGLEFLTELAPTKKVFIIILVYWTNDKYPLFATNTQLLHVHFRSPLSGK